MEMNLVSLVMQFLTPDMITRIAAALGLDRSNTQKAVGAAVPALLAGVSSAAAMPDGAQRAVDAIRQQGGMLDGFANLIDGSGQMSLVDRGSSLLESVLSGYDQSALADAVGKFAGLGSGATNSLLAMLAPAVMGIIGKQFSGGKVLDAGSLTGLLASQKDQIAQALPAGFNKLLAGTGLLDSLGGAAGSAAAAAGQASQFGSSAARRVSGAGRRAANGGWSGVPTWTYWVIPLALIVGLIWYLTGNRTDQVTQQLSPPVATTAQNVVVGGVDIGKQLDDSVGSVRAALQGVTDAASATAAIPKLQEATTQMDKISGMLGLLSADQRKIVAGLVESATATLNQALDKVQAIPGVKDVLEPAIGPLKAKLADLSTQSSTVGSGRP
jgi:hypothetical protein